MYAFFRLKVHEFLIKKHAFLNKYAIVVSCVLIAMKILIII